jgi:mannose-6-phosphate isomerase-like protein (cupin superfamily)
MIGYTGPIEELTRGNSNFRQVLFTAPHSQLVLMSLLPNEEIGMEVHPENDQFFRFETGEGKVVIAGVEYPVKDGDAVVVPAGTQHNVINTSATTPLKLYTIYSPAHHPDGTIHKTKAEALAAEKHE